MLLHLELLPARSPLDLRTPEPLRQRWEVGWGKVGAGHDGDVLHLSDVLLEVSGVEDWVVTSPVPRVVQKRG